MTFEANRIIQGDALAVLKSFPDGCVDCCVTSPPYLWLRDYEVPPTKWPAVGYRPMPGWDYPVVIEEETSCLGLENTIEAYVGHLVLIFRYVRDILKPEGSLWLNLGDGYHGSGKAGNKLKHKVKEGEYPKSREVKYLKRKDMYGIPWRVAFALQADGWYLRNDNIWFKTNPLPDSVKDRPVKTHEYVFLLTKNEKYYYDYEAVKEPCSPLTHSRGRYHRTSKVTDADSGMRNNESFVKAIWDKSGNKVRKYGESRNRSGSHKGASVPWDGDTRNMRSVWQINVEPYPGEHSATFPCELVRPCIRAGCPPGGIVLDPFAGTGTVGQVALEEGRNYLLIEIDPKSIIQAQERIYHNSKTLGNFSEAS